jgi:hypothetical protein
VLLTDGDQLRTGRALVTFTERRQANLVESDKIDLAIGPPTELSVETGLECTVPISVTNLTGRVDWFLLDLLGLPADWWRIVMPDGSAGQPPLLPLFSTTRAIRAADARGVVKLVIAPPRLATSTAGQYPLLVTATGQSGDRPRRPASGQLNVLPFFATSLAITTSEPQSSDPRRFRVQLRNDGNSAQYATLDASPPDRVRATTSSRNWPAVLAPHRPPTSTYV